MPQAALVVADGAQCRRDHPPSGAHAPSETLDDARYSLCHGPPFEGTPSAEGQRYRQPTHGPSHPKRERASAARSGPVAGVARTLVGLLALAETARVAVPFARTSGA